MSSPFLFKNHLSQSIKKNQGAAIENNMNSIYNSPSTFLQEAL